MADARLKATNSFEKAETWAEQVQGSLKSWESTKAGLKEVDVFRKAQV